MVAKEHKKKAGSPKVEVGEIDTRAPFQSVKDAVTLFGEGAFSGDKPTIKKTKPHSAERVIAKTTQLHLAQKELNKLKERLNSAETTKAQALSELEKAKRTMNDLTQKLNTVTESKASAIKVTEDAKKQAKQIEETKNSNLSEPDGTRMQDLEATREQYAAVFDELDSTKQELRKIHQECDALLEAKHSALDQAAKAEQTARENAEKVGELSKEISILQESIGQVKMAALHAQQEQAKIFAEKDTLRQSYKTTLEASANKLLELKKQFDPELAQNLQKQLNDTICEIEGLQKQMESAKASDLDSMKAMTSELDGAKESLRKIVEEETSLQSLVESLKLELENVKKEHVELTQKEAETESIAGNLHEQLCKAKAELSFAQNEETRVRSSYEEMISMLHQLSLEAENARKEAEEMKKEADDLKKEAETTKFTVEEGEKKLRLVLEEAEEAKAAETRALEQIKTLSERANAARTSTSESGAKITISREEFEALRRKAEESDSLAEMKVAAAVAQVEAVKASENEALKKLELMQKEIDETKALTEEALKRAEMAEAAKRAVEGELRRRREQEQKKAAEVASRILTETEKTQEQKKAAEVASRILTETEKTSVATPPHYSIQKQNTSLGKVVEVQKLGKERSFVSKKTLLPNLSGIFQRKRNQIEGGSPSYLPGERPTRV